MADAVVACAEKFGKLACFGKANKEKRFLVKFSFEKAFRIFDRAKRKNKRT